MNDNIVSLVPQNGEQEIPESTYEVTDIDDIVHVADGFLVFTSAHVAVMREIKGLGALPVLVLPLHRVKSAELVEDTDENMPF